MDATKEEFYQLIWDVVLVHVLGLALGIWIYILQKDSETNQLQTSQSPTECETTACFCLEM